ncbi:MAG: serine--tRNA ligase [Candidatus Omnitrophota bacterium]
MLDIKWIRENRDAFVKGMEAKGCPGHQLLEELLAFDERRRSILKEVEDLKARRNQANQEIASLKAQKKSADKILDEMKALSQKIKNLDSDVGEVIEKESILMLSVPNIPDFSVPVAKGNEGNKIVRTWGDPRKLPFDGKEHQVIAGALGWLDMERGSKIAGSAFPVYKGQGARLERALVNFMLDLHTREHGYQEVWPPALVNRASMTGTGQLPKLEADMYRLAEDDLFLIPTGEVPVTNLLRDEVLAEEQLPVYYTAYTPCFRREAGSYGKDTKGLSRVHQFDKVEMVKFVKPETSADELEKLVKDAEAVLQALELPYRVVFLGSGDMSFAASRCYDLEVWAPVSKRWYEVSSCSTFGDFQARRMNIRFRSKSSGKVEFVHTLNGSGVALARTLLCLLENFQTRDGKVDFPAALRPYLS